jgi:hypothetical protein
MKDFRGLALPHEGLLVLRETPHSLRIEHWYDLVVLDFRSHKGLPVVLCQQLCSQHLLGRKVHLDTNITAVADVRAVHQLDDPTILSLDLLSSLIGQRPRRKILIGIELLAVSHVLRQVVDGQVALDALAKDNRANTSRS